MYIFMYGKKQNNALFSHNKLEFAVQDDGGSGLPLHCFMRYFLARELREIVNYYTFISHLEDLEIKITVKRITYF